MPQQSLLPLKILVYALGILLIGGFVWVAALVMSKVESRAACTEITLPAGNAYYADGYWIVQQGEKILRFDNCGKQVQQVTQSVQ